MKKSLLVVAALAIAPFAHSAELIQNGGFEMDGVDSFEPMGWSVFESAAIGGVSATSSNMSPASGYAMAAPVTGDFIGVIDAYNPGAFSLSQQFSTAAVASAVLKFDLFVNDQSDDGIAYIDRSGLDFETGGEFRPNQHVRIDLLAAGADPLDTGAGVLRTFYLGGANGRGFGDNPNRFVSYEFDLGSDLAAGGDYTLRFAAVSNVAAMQVGLDNVSLSVSAVPEPGTYALLLSGLALIGAVARRRI